MPYLKAESKICSGTDVETGGLDARVLSCVSETGLVSGGHSQVWRGFPKPTFNSKASFLPNCFFCTTQVLLNMLQNSRLLHFI